MNAEATGSNTIEAPPNPFFCGGGGGGGTKRDRYFFISLVFLQFTSFPKLYIICQKCEKNPGLTDVISELHVRV